MHKIFEKIASIVCIVYQKDPNITLNAKKFQIMSNSNF